MALRAGLLQACLCVLLCCTTLAAAQDVNLQGTYLYQLGKWLSADDTALLDSLGWANGGNPCAGSWQGVACNGDGYVTSVSLPNKGLKGSLPSESAPWSGLTHLTTLDLTGNLLGGEVPSSITAAGSQLTSINLSGNSAICGTVPAGIPVDTAGTSVGTDCTALWHTVSPAADTSPSPEPSTASPSPAPATPAVAASPAPAPAPPAAPVSPSPQPVAITNAPICSCALKGFGSGECKSAVQNLCNGGNGPAVCSAGDPASVQAAAELLGQYLDDTCFPGQRDTSICSCAQNLLGNDCAKARLSLCVAKDSLCLPFQNIIDKDGSSSADAVNRIAPVLNDKCPISDPSVPGVKATMQFPDLSIGQYITNQYAQNVANVLSSITQIPTAEIATLDIRPFIGGSSSNGRRRSLLQSPGNGVQATYFIASSTPAAVADKLTQAAQDKSLSTKLEQYGISSMPGGLRMTLVEPVSPASGSSAFPMWVVGVIVAVVVVVAALACMIWICCFRRKKSHSKAKEYTPETKDAGVDILPKSSYDYAPASPGPYTPGVATTPVVVGPAATLDAIKTTSAVDLPVSRSIKVPAPASVANTTTTAWDASSTGGSAGSATRAAGPASGSPVNLPPVKTSVGGDQSATMPTTSSTNSLSNSLGNGATAAAGAASAAAGWRSNVRPATGQLPATAGATSSMAATAGKGTQQAERAKFWAQFQETWQQVRQNQSINNDEPGTPSSGTNWTENTGQISPQKRHQ